MKIWSGAVVISMIVTMERLDTETPVLSEGWPGWITLTGTVLTRQSHGVTAGAISQLAV